MAETTNLPEDDANILALLQHLAITLPRYAEILGLSHDELTQAIDAAAWFKFALDFDDAAKAYALAVAAFKKAVRDGQKFGALNFPALNPSTPPPGEPFADAAGFLEKRVVSIRLHPRFSEAIGAALKIPPVQLNSLDFDTVRPSLSLELLGGHPNIHWKMNGMDGLEIEVDRGDGIFSLLTIEPAPDFLDLAPLPSPGNCARWRYRAIYQHKDQRVGHWSQVLVVEVKGV